VVDDIALIRINVSAMTIEIHDEEQYSLLRPLEAELSDKVFEELQNLVSEKMETGNYNFILDLELVEEPQAESFSSFEVLGLLIEKEGGILIVSTPFPELRDALEERAINCAPTLTEAVDYMFMEQLQKQLEEGDLEEE
jgi:hypothetical protein